MSRTERGGLEHCQSPDKSIGWRDGRVAEGAGLLIHDRVAVPQVHLKEIGSNHGAFLAFQKPTKCPLKHPKKARFLPSSIRFQYQIGRPILIKKIIFELPKSLPHPDNRTFKLWRSNQNRGFVLKSPNPSDGLSTLMRFRLSGIASFCGFGF